MEFILNDLDERLVISLNLIMNVFKKYGNISNYPFIIEKVRIEKILTLLSVELYHPSKFEFNNEFVTYSEILKTLKHTFCRY